MKKNRTKRSRRQAVVPCHLPGVRRAVPVQELDGRAGLLELVVEAGFTTVARMFEEERERLCGPPRRCRFSRPWDPCFSEAFPPRDPVFA